MLNLYEILKRVLNESVSNDVVQNAIAEHNYVVITYDDEKSHKTGKRLIQPYAYGVTTAGNEALRAFQVSGDSLRGRPKWKLFRLDRILSWEPRRQKFYVPPPMQGYNSPDYNREGDETMARVIFQATFDGIDDSLEAARLKRKGLENAPKIASKNTSGPIPNASQQWKRNVFTSQPHSKKYAATAKNIIDTEKDINRFDDDIWARAEAEKNQQDLQKIQNSVPKPKQNKQGPVLDDDNDNDEY